VDGLLMAEQCIDRQAKTEVFRGRQIELITGRILLHALDHRGEALCGRDKAELSLTGRPWDASYFPHLPRCQGCTEVTEAPVVGRDTVVDIRTAHGTDDEEAGAAALRAILDDYDLRCWLFTDLVTIDDQLRGGLSHPLTISPGLLVQRPALALTTFLHEQLHWLDGPGTVSATAEASERWPDPPPLSAGGATDPASTWLHMSTCALEYQSLSQILGAPAAADELQQHTSYSWIYGLILADPGWFSGFLRRHGLQLGVEPPLPRRCFGEMPWAAHRAGGSSARR
jgi:hypothetical protein